MINITSVTLSLSVPSGPGHDPPADWFFRSDALSQRIDVPPFGEVARSTISVSVGVDGAELVGFSVSGEDLAEWKRANEDRPPAESARDFSLLLTHWLVSAALERQRDEFADHLEMLTVLHPWLLPE